VNEPENDLDTLRRHLFDTLADLRDRNKPVDVERAKAVVAVADKLIETGKVEVQYLNIVGGKGSGFIPDGTPKLPRLVGQGKQ